MTPTCLPSTKLTHFFICIRYENVLTKPLVTRTASV